MRIEADHRVPEGCLERLGAHSRSVVERYYQHGEVSLLKNRKRLADELGISIENLAHVLCACARHWKNVSGRFRHSIVEGKLGQMTSDRRHLAEFLLGRLPPRQADAVGERLFGEEEFLSEMEEVERDLLDAYGQGKLTKAESLAVETAFMESEPRRERLRFAVALSRRPKTTGAYCYRLAAAAVLFCLSGATAWMIRLSAMNGRLQSDLTSLRMNQVKLENSPSVAFL